MYPRETPTDAVELDSSLYHAGRKHSLASLRISFGPGLWIFFLEMAYVQNCNIIRDAYPIEGEFGRFDAKAPSQTCSQNRFEKMNDHFGKRQGRQFHLAGRVEEVDNVGQA
jgi:hypothetical protein